MASSSSGREGELDPCPICLNPLVQEAYLDRCFHVFCYPCIVYWTRLVTEKQSLSSIKCPLCKAENFSIIHSYTGDSFQQNYVNKDSKKSSLLDSHEFRLKFYGASSRMRNGPFDVQRYWKNHRYLLKNTWLETWLRREIQALSQVEDVDIVMHHIHGVVDSFIKSKEKEGRKCTPEQNRNAFRHLLLDAGRPAIRGVQPANRRSPAPTPVRDAAATAGPPPAAHASSQQARVRGRCAPSASLPAARAAARSPTLALPPPRRTRPRWLRAHPRLHGQRPRAPASSRRPQRRLAYNRTR
ncbi:uncharacterized protein LOC120263689 [Dioscorea cayenensis subsp. rotundata]|uniref:Uncharacterized protein LOC120263689 n=1 Tax=Dioscorea cayennensis subsp. rotundata TaxID=55577 RepID=A0AB40BJK0_DIOCR|nr:uncharacterized protein LOC120263689 [Dioscorea cayenensis subsp. rotundata]